MRFRGLLVASRVRVRGNRLVEEGEEWRLVWDPNERLRLRRQRGEEPLYTQFASLDESNPEALAAFVSREGWPGTGDIATLAREVRRIRAVLRLAEALDHEPPDPQQLEHAFRAFGEAWDTFAGPQGGGRAEARRLLSEALSERLRNVRVMVGDLDGALELALVPDNLLDVIYVEMALDLVAGGAVPRLCEKPGCGRWFLATRKDRRYCSKQCQTAARVRRYREAKRAQKA